jgi:hypothetical protein
MLNLDTLHTARLIQEQAYPERLEWSRRLREARAGQPQPRPRLVMALGRLIARGGDWIQGHPVIPLPESPCHECRQPVQGMST